MVMTWLYRIALLACFITGYSYFVSSARYEWYTVPEKEIDELSSRMRELPDNLRTDLWFAEMHKLETPRKQMHDLGVGIMALAAVLGWLKYSFNFPLQGSRTPNSSVKFFLVYTLLFVAQVPAAMYYFGHRQARFEYPVWGDSLAIAFFPVLLGSACFSFIGWVALIFIPYLATFPASLFVWMPSRPFMSGIVTALFGMLAAMCLIPLPYSVQDGDVGGVLLFTAMPYIFLSARAGVIEHQIIKQRDLQISDPPVSDSSSD